MENNYQNSVKSEINLTYMLLSILRHWRIMLAGIWAGVILLGAYAVVHNYMRDMDTAVDVPDRDVESDDHRHTEKAIEAYKSIISGSRDYLEGSIYLNLEASSVQVMEDVYYVSSEKENETAVIKMISTIVKGDKFCRKVSDAVGEDLKEQYLNELISFDFSLDSAHDMGTTNRSSNYLSVLQNAGGQPGTAFSIKIKGKDKDFCEKVGKCFESFVQEKSTDICSLLGDFDLLKVSSVFYKQQENNILSQKRSILVQIAADENALKQQESALRSSKDKSAGLKLSVTRCMLAGAIFGVFAVAVFYAVMYTCSSRLRAAEDMEKVYGLRIFRIDGNENESSNRKGNKPGKKPTGLDSILINISRNGHHYYDTGNLAHIICTLVSSSKSGFDGKADSKGQNESNGLKLFISADKEYLDGNTSVDLLVSKLAAMDVSVKTGSNPAYDADSMKILNDCDCVMLVETVNSSMYSDINEKLRCIKECGKQVIGCIIIEAY